MNKYKKLISNSMIMSVGTLGSKLITILLLPLYTYYLSTEEYGTVDLITTTIQLLLPIVSLSMNQAILRFTMDYDSNKSKVISNSTIISLIGFCFSLLFYFPLTNLNTFENYTKYLYLILFLQIFQLNFSEYSRAIGKIKIYSINGILLSFSLGILNIFFLVILNLGIDGYFMAMIISYAISIVYLFLFSGIKGTLNFKHFNFSYSKELLKYAFPLIPNTIMWWLINASSRYFITYFSSLAANGIFALSSRIPSLLNIITQIFSQAWQLSAIEEYETEQNSEFSSTIFEVYSVVLIIFTSIIILILKPIFNFLFSSEYYVGWEATPFLLLGSVFSAFSGFFGTNYIASKQSTGVLKSSVLGGISSLILNTLLIPAFGINGAGFSSMLSFLIIFLYRYHDTQNYIKTKINWKNLLLNFSIIFLQILIIFINLNLIIEIVLNAILLFVIIFYNRKYYFLIIKYNKFKH